MSVPRRTIALSVAAALSLIALFVFSQRDATKGTSRGDGLASSNASAPKIALSVLAPKLAIPVGSATVAPSASATAPRPSVLAAWGSGLGALGHKSPDEANPEAPMSLYVDANGVTWVIDQVNDRIVRYGKDGKVIDTLPLPVKAAQDVAIAKDGTALVLDRLVDKRIAVLGPDGKPLGSLSLEGKGLSEGGAATGVFVDGNSVYVEREHEQLVRVGDIKGNADPERKEIPGRPTRDGRGYVRAWLEPVPGNHLYLTGYDKDPEGHRFTRHVQTPLLMNGILLLDSDRAGVIYVAVIGAPLSPSGEPGEPVVSLYCFEPTHGVPIGQATLPANTSAEETFREFSVLETGGAVYMTRTDQGVSITPVDCRPQQ